MLRDGEPAVAVPAVERSTIQHVHALVHTSALQLGRSIECTLFCMPGGINCPKSKIKLLWSAAGMDRGALLPPANAYGGWYSSHRISHFARRYLSTRRMQLSNFKEKIL